MNDEELAKFIDRKVAEIQEHCDSVQILAEKNDGETSRSIFRGGGSWFARQGLVHEFLQQGKAQLNAKEMRDALPPQPPDEEDWKES